MPRAVQSFSHCGTRHGPPIRQRHDALASRMLSLPRRSRQQGLSQSSMNWAWRRHCMPALPLQHPVMARRRPPMASSTRRASGYLRRGTSTSTPTTQTAAVGGRLDSHDVGECGELGRNARAVMDLSTVWAAVRHCSRPGFTRARFEGVSLCGGSDGWSGIGLQRGRFPEGLASPGARPGSAGILCFHVSGLVQVRNALKSVRVGWLWPLQK